MVALKQMPPNNLCPFPTSNNKYAIVGNMNPPIRPSDWIYCLNSFRQYSPLQDYIFALDRDFTVKSYRDAIFNNLHCHQDIALNIVAPDQGLPLSQKRSADTAYANNVEPISRGTRQYLDNLLHETRLLSEVVPKSRMVNYLHVSNSVSKLFGPAEMTELMFNLSKNFALRHDGSGRYVIELEGDQCHDSKIALIKGLGFNHICLDIKASDHIEITNKVATIRDYEFESVHSRLHMDESNLQHYQNQLNQLVKAAPDTICIADKHANNSLTPLTLLPPLTWEHQLLIDNGYKKISCRRYVHEDYEDIWCIHDLLSVGLGGTSFIDNIFSHNAHQLDQYYDLLSQEELPFTVGGYIHKKK